MFCLAVAFSKEASRGPWVKTIKEAGGKRLFLSSLTGWAFESIRLRLRKLFDFGICICSAGENRCRRQCVSSTRELCLIQKRFCRDHFRMHAFAPSLISLLPQASPKIRNII